MSNNMETLKLFSNQNSREKKEKPVIYINENKKFLDNILIFLTDENGEIVQIEQNFLSDFPAAKIGNQKCKVLDLQITARFELI